MNFDGDDGFEQDRRAIGHAIAHGDARRRLESHLGGINIVIGAVREIDSEIHHRESKGPMRHPFAHAKFHGGDVGLGHHAAGDRICEAEARAARCWCNLHHDIAELAVAAGLLLVATANLRLFADRLLIGNAARR